jgi:ketosteroid isomerase-like protein
MPSMKRDLAASVFVFSLVLVLAPGGRGISQSNANNQNPAASQQTEDQKEAREQAEQGIKHLLVTQIEAWNKGDLEGFMAGYWHSPELTFFSAGNIAKGWAAALQRYQRKYQGKGKEMGHLEFQDLKIDLLGQRAAVVTGKWQLTMSDNKTPHGLFTLIVKQLQNGWRIVHDHTSSAEEK